MIAEIISFASKEKPSQENVLKNSGGTLLTAGVLLKKKLFVIQEFLTIQEIEQPQVKRILNYCHPFSQIILFFCS